MGPPTQRLLVAGTTVDALVDRFQAFGGLFADDPGAGQGVAFPVTVSEPAGAWIAVQLPAEIPRRHAHNLAVWVDLDPQRPRDLLLVSTGPGDAAYWLTRCAQPDARHVLAGATQSGLPFQVDCVSGDRFDDPSFRVPPLPTGLALLRRGVHAALHRPDGVPAAAQVSVPLPPLPAEPWSIPPPMPLSAELARARAHRVGVADLVQTWVQRTVRAAEQLRAGASASPPPGDQDQDTA